MLQAHDILTLKALIIFGADISCVNDCGQTPLDIAKEVTFQVAIDLLQSTIDNNRIITSQLGTDRVRLLLVYIYIQFQRNQSVLVNHPKGTGYYVLMGEGSKALC